MFQKNIDRILLVAILIVGLIGVFGGSKKSGVLGVYDYSKTSVTDSDALVTGSLTVLGTTTLSGTLSGFATSSLTTLTVSGATALQGATTLSGITKVQASASSTIIVGGAGTGGGYTAGCIKLGDSASATSTPVYITATGATITATTTRPASCSSQ